MINLNCVFRSFPTLLDEGKGETKIITIIFQNKNTNNADLIGLAMMCVAIVSKNSCIFFSSNYNSNSRNNTTKINVGGDYRWSDVGPFGRFDRLSIRARCTHVVFLLLFCVFCIILYFVCVKLDWNDAVSIWRWFVLSTQTRSS